ncbi:hypothetical protein EJ05DRAFT_512264 [Pseudovirgaria hyperparasitica]|uniref:Uncharacterized protein n=1 Tax=Pseudovirgaria hyperparasitica TaxID=470096 RepID=A0A6A6W3N8_9PEZI|nr:uncharacterized protein EJ05DRAFT_512264 [Pseudovirgaria hyperparasitica]KAF2756634.1 hypothetical protein EJ05DRAFT_512264 [Pseudovirgaria hyperparasitica]
MSQLPFQWPTNLFRAPLTKDVSKNVIGVCRSFHASQFQRDEANDSRGPSSSTPDRIARSQLAARQISNLQAARGFQRKGLRGGVFKSGAVQSPPLHMRNAGPVVRPVTDPSQKTPNVGFVIRRTTEPAQRMNRSPGRLLSRPTSSPQMRAPQGGGGRGRGATRGGRGRRGNRGNRGRGRELQREGYTEPADEGIHPDEIEDGDELSNTMVRFLREEHERVKGEKPYQLEKPDAGALLDETRTSLPPMPWSLQKIPARKLLTQYLEGTTPMAWSPFAMPLGKSEHLDAKRMISGLLVHFEPKAGGPPDRTMNKQMGLINQRAMSKAMTKLREYEATRMKAEGIKVDETVRFKSIPKHLREETTMRVLAGQYELSSSKDEESGENASKDPLVKNVVTRALQVNPSYDMTKMDAFMNVVDGLIAGKPRGKAPKMGIT